MLFPCRDPSTTLPRPCHCPAILRQCRTRAGLPRAVSGRPMLIHIYHAVLMPFPCREPAVALRGRFQNGIFMAWQGNGMVCVNQTRPQCVHQMGKTQTLSETSWERHGMCESALSVCDGPSLLVFHFTNSPSCDPIMHFAMKPTLIRFQKSCSAIVESG
jgi:hypothetical protein